MSICGVHPRKASHSRCDVLKLPDCGLGLGCASKHLQPILLYILSCHSSVCRMPSSKNAIFGDALIVVSWFL
ncbi:hypothetical protein R1sor_009922 [Riccia sorocarpa]|uniref:Uncharacterized protein n=1 Tax=Riccia sorocarpa TaxID=122646 RepID=A0ABD3I0K4_9MARC